MKNLLKIGALALALVGTANVAGAQSLNRSATLATTANVATDIVVTKQLDLDFGTFYRNVGVAVASKNNANAGAFTVNGTASTLVTAVLAPTALTDGTSNLPVTWAYAYVSGSGNCTADLPTNGQISLSSGGLATVCVGGSIPALATTYGLGSYTGTVVLTVTFP